MNKFHQEGEHLDGPVQEDPQADSLIRQLAMAYEINSRARSLLHADTQSDAAIDTLENLRHITGVKTLSVFKKHLGEDGDMTFEWRCRTGSASTDRDAWQLSSLEGAACEQLAAKKPVRVTLAKSGATVNQDVGDDGCKPGLIIPINVFGAWWGGLCVDYGATEVDKDTPVSESFATAADFLGVFFERQIASRESTESDKLAGSHPGRRPKATNSLARWKWRVPYATNSISPCRLSWGMPAWSPQGISVTPNRYATSSK